MWNGYFHASNEISTCRRSVIKKEVNSIAISGVVGCLEASKFEGKMDEVG